MISDDEFGEANPYEAPRAQDVVVKSRATETREIDLSVDNPFLTIWTRPRATIRAIVNTDPHRHIVPLAILGGIVQTLDRASQRNAGDKLPFAAILGMAMLLGPVGGLLSLFVGGWFLGLTGRSLGGRARPEQLRAAIAWSFVPVLATIPIWIIQLGFFGRELFTRETPTLDANPTLGLVLLATGMLEAALGLWSFVILLKGVGEVQGFSAWKALISLVLIGLAIILLVFVPIVLVLVVVGLSTR
jgi:Yip1 domain